ncbi:hypothetical protein GCM10023175_17730 [Pseudonocardia xishanensis]|uniref:Luciferase-like monooxygenase n=1 Tax=Pseudonocardia xishanensis TaxID=630995 RepID=A0ABP8RN63_9PSEU
MTSSDADTGENFRGGGLLAHSGRYERAGETLDAVRALWDSWGSDAVVADPATGRFLWDGKARVAKVGRDLEQVEMPPSAAVILGDTEAEARDRPRDVRSRQVDPFTAVVPAEMVWNRDLSAVDPDGPVPDPRSDPRGPGVDPRAGPADPGRARHRRGPGGRSGASTGGRCARSSRTCSTARCPSARRPGWPPRSTVTCSNAPSTGTSSAPTPAPSGWTRWWRR